MVNDRAFEWLKNEVVFVVGKKYKYTMKDVAKYGAYTLACAGRAIEVKRQIYGLFNGKGL